MMIIMKANATPEQIEDVIEHVKAAGLNAHLSQGVEATIIGAIGEAHNIPTDIFEGLDGVDMVKRITQPFKLASRQFHPENSIFPLDGFSVGGEEIAIIAGPCSVESRSQIIETAQAVKEAGASALRGGVFKPRTSPYSFQGLGEEGLEYLADARQETGLPIVSEIMSQTQLDLMVRCVDVFQVGARNMQNFNLLRAIGETQKPVLLKRGLSATIEELLMSAEYILAGGNRQVMLCERGIRTFETATRNTTDINAIPVLKNLTHLPVILDPSHATGHADYVASIARAAIAAGADGLMVEVHPNPAHAVSDGKQSLRPEKFAEMVRQVGQIAQVMGRKLAAVQTSVV
ncbi:MAG TPA: 3-deoxy-7-phosphoheptulonate synthase [Anaerolineales bacterium]|nr:3-deoxy-7-phosphoheptulonate synthase [Anaerolineales bacterium]